MPVFDQVSFGYTPEKKIFQNTSISADLESRIALVRNADIWYELQTLLLVWIDADSLVYYSIPITDQSKTQSECFYQDNMDFICEVWLVDNHTDVKRKLLPR